MRKPKRHVNFDDLIKSIIYDENHEPFGKIIFTHLAIEAILLEILAICKANKVILKSSFSNKTQFLVDREMITEADRDALNKYNDFRNDIAHIFGHKINIKDVLALAYDLESLGVDFSDSLGSYSIDEAEEYFIDVSGCLVEVSSCILFHAANILLISGGRDIFADYE